MSFEEGFLYPFSLLITGGILTGILIPWYTNRQQVKQCELDKVRESTDKAKEEKRIDNEKELERMRKDRELAIERERQDIQFKIKLKQDLMEAFHNYRTTGIAEIQNFMGEIFDYYAISDVHFNKISRLSQGVIEFPKNSEKIPEKIFGKKWNELQPKISRDLSFYSNLFLLKLEWYSNNNDIQKKFDELRDGVIEIKDMVINVIRSKNAEKFLTNYANLIEKWEICNIKFNEFRGLLVRSKITDLAV